MTDPRTVLVLDASIIEADGRASIAVNGERLETPAGNPVDPSIELAEAMVEELLADGAVDVTRPSLYAFYSTERDFIAPDPTRTIDTLVELLAHDFLVHPDERLGRRQVQVAAWKAQIDLWLRLAGREPPYAPADGDPDIHRHDYGAFRELLARFTPSQLSIAIYAANVLKSATLGMLLAERAIDAPSALEAAAVTPRMVAGDTQGDLERQQEREEEWRQAIERLLRYAELAASDSPFPPREGG